MLGDPRAELRELIAAKLDAKMRSERLDDSFDGHDYADAVMELFTVEEDYSSIEVRAIEDRAESAMWHRRLIAKTDWKPTAGPLPQTRRMVEWLRANGIDPDTVLASPAPYVEGSVIVVHHVPPTGLGMAGGMRRTYPVTVPLDEGLDP